MLVAPLDPECPHENLGAAQKITLVARLLHGMGLMVHFVDSSHSQPRWKRETQGAPCTIGDVPVTLWRPPMFRSRPVGKLLNVIHLGNLPERLAALNPSLVWLYNPYAFEARLGSALARRCNAKVLLELEDLPTARRRGLSPKPWIDQIYFQGLLRTCDFITYVNADLMRSHPPRKGRSMLFPSIIGSDLESMPLRTRFSEAPFRIGYFGGLEREKGAEALLAAVPVLPAHWRLVATGTGSLSRDFESLMQRHPDRLEFHGQVTRGRLIELMGTCDAIVNPHSPISAMANGVFPFKVCEALVTGALLISTPVPAIAEPIEEAFIAFDGSATDFVASLELAPDRYRCTTSAINRVREAILARYSEAAVSAQLRALLGGVRA